MHGSLDAGPVCERPSWACRCSRAVSFFLSSDCLIESFSLADNLSAPTRRPIGWVVGFLLRAGDDRHADEGLALEIARAFVAHRIGLAAGSSTFSIFPLSTHTVVGDAHQRFLDLGLSSTLFPHPPCGGLCGGKARDQHGGRSHQQLLHVVLLARCGGRISLEQRPRPSPPAASSPCARLRIGSPSRQQLGEVEAGGCELGV